MMYLLSANNILLFYYKKEMIDGNDVLICNIAFGVLFTLLYGINTLLSLDVIFTESIPTIVSFLFIASLSLLVVNTKVLVDPSEDNPDEERGVISYSAVVSGLSFLYFVAVIFAVISDKHQRSMLLNEHSFYFIIVLFITMANLVGFVPSIMYFVSNN